MALEIASGGYVGGGAVRVVGPSAPDARPADFGGRIRPETPGRWGEVTLHHAFGVLRAGDVCPQLRMSGSGSIPDVVTVLGDLRVGGSIGAPAPLISDRVRVHGRAEVELGGALDGVRPVGGGVELFGGGPKAVNSFVFRDGAVRLGSYEGPTLSVAARGVVEIDRFDGGMLALGSGVTELRVGSMILRSAEHLMRRYGLAAVNPPGGLAVPSPCGRIEIGSLVSETDSDVVLKAGHVALGDVRAARLVIESTTITFHGAVEVGTLSLVRQGADEERGEKVYDVPGRLRAECVSIAVPPNGPDTVVIL